MVPRTGNHPEQGSRSLHGNLHWQSALSTPAPQNIRGAAGDWNSLGRDHQEAKRLNPWHGKRRRPVSVSKGQRVEASGKSKSSHPEDWGAEVGRLSIGRGKEGLPDPAAWRGQTLSPFREGPRAFRADKLQSECRLRLDNLKRDPPSRPLGSQHCVWSNSQEPSWP